MPHCVVHVCMDAVADCVGCSLLESCIDDSVRVMAVVVLVVWVVQQMDVSG